MALLEKIFGSPNEKQIKEAESFVSQINELEKNPPAGGLAKTEDLKKRIQEGESLDNILPQAFAAVREAAKQTLSQRHFDVQLIGGMVLHQGKIAEMRTGEGKTLTATLAVYLNALEGKGVHVITVNDYLAKRDMVWMGQIYHKLGLTVGCITHDSSYVYDPNYQTQEQQSSGSDEERDEERDEKGSFKVEESYLKPVNRKEAYAADITYGTNNEFGFDYLRDNMAQDASQQVQRGNHYAIIDEIDSVLIDEARTPLIISAPDQQSSQWYHEFAKITPQLQRDTDYEIDEKMKAVTITDAGIDKVEKVLGLEDIYQEKGIKYVHHLEEALKAETLFKKDKDYVVKDGQVMIIDEFTGRMLEGRRYSGGLHQALEAKEGVQVQPESMTFASITFQNYFRMYEKLAGMTGTAATSAEEFHKVYELEVVMVPTNKPTIRKDLPDKIYKTLDGKFKAVVGEIKARHEKGQPVLVGTVSIEKNEYISRMLDKEGIEHKMLNAKQHEKEGEIIAQAGRAKAVTVATNMAGRGVDIVLGGNPPDEREAEKVRELGGLHVMGTERHEARRIDNQLRGRGGRQGDPGSTQFFISLEDDLARVFGGEKIKGIMDKLKIPEDEAIEAGLVSKSIESAQSKIEGFNFDARKNLLEYDDVLNKHREAVYRKRNEILQKAVKGELKEYLRELVGEEQYDKKEQELGEEKMRQAEQFVSLRVIDSFWVGHLEQMEYLRDSVRLRAYGQQDPLVEYKNEGRKMYQELLEKIDSTIIHALSNIQLTPENQSSTSSTAPHQHQHQHSQPAEPKVGRNDPCPCGSREKWKRCGMINAPSHKS